MKIRNTIILLALWISTISPVVAGNEWNSISEQIASIKPTYDSSVAKANEKETQSIEPPFLRDSIVATVSQLDGAGNRNFFLRVLPSNNILVRRSAVQALSRLPHDHETVTALRNSLLSDKDPMVRRDAAFALGNFREDQWAKQGLEQALGEEQGVLQAIKFSLQKFKPGK